MDVSSYKQSATRRWESTTLFAVCGLLLFETLTGLSILFLPFSVSTQLMVLLHTGVGLLFILPYTYYQIRHWRVHQSRPLTHVKLTGYFSLVATVAAGLSGLVLAYQALFSTRISSFWDTTHLISTFALIAAVLPHVISVGVRNYRNRHLPALQPILTAEKHWAFNTTFIAGTLLALTGLLVYAYQPVALDNQLPADYSFPHGQDSAFAPSLAQTASGKAIDVRALGGSASCGTAGCHKQIYEEWLPSAHRYSAMDPAFREIQEMMGQQNGPQATRYCGGCHDPISLFSGTKNLFEKELSNPTGHQEGVSCMSCHAIERADVKGNAAYVIGQPERYIGELRDGTTARWLSEFLIRAYPEQHNSSLNKTLYKTSEFCGTCHKQFIDEELNNVGWVQLQNQYDNWRKSRWNTPGEPTKTIECRECHMPLTDSFDPSSGDALDYNRSPDDNRHRSHRFLASNQLIPEALDLEGAREHTRLTEKWLRGEIEIPEIDDKWREGPVVPVELVAPDTVKPGEKISLRVVMTNNKAGHNFPTGPLDMIQAWLEVTVTDPAGNRIWSSGTLDENQFIEPGSFVFKAEAVDQYGNLIDRHNLWDMVGTRYSRTLFPGFSDQTTYDFTVPDTLLPDTRSSVIKPAGLASQQRQQTVLEVSVRLRYRKINQALMNTLFGDDPRLDSAPITELSSTRTTIQVVSR
jgi:hypothetical protein